MIDRVIILLACLMISLILSILSLQYPSESNIILSVIAVTGSLLAIYEFIKK